MTSIRFSLKNSTALSLIFALVTNPLSSAWATKKEQDLNRQEQGDYRKPLTTRQVRDLIKIAEGTEPIQAAEANYKLGENCYYQDEDREDAIEYLKKALDLGYQNAQTYLMKIAKEELEEKLQKSEIASQFF